MHIRSYDDPISTNWAFEREYGRKVRALLTRDPINRGPAHATKDETMASTHELMHLREVFLVDQEPAAWQETIKPSLPWAEDHFQERVGGEPLNPAPSEAWWPFARQGNAEHKKDAVFSHTYPERFWPKRAGLPDDYCPYPDSCTVEEHRDHWGIRFKYGDLNDLLTVLKKNKMSRQAYLPVWFPEDLTAAAEGERVPCSMGYHFICDGASGELDCVYSMRSCDIVRFYRDDIYMAGRLLQWVAEKTEARVGSLIVHIDNLHCFPGDRLFLESFLPKTQADKRAGYNFGALG
jgi:hypothetical protein